LGQLHDVTCLLAILAVTDGQSCDQVARTLRVTLKTVHQWVRRLLVAGPAGLQRTKPTGRPAKLTKTQKHELATLLDAGPVQAGLTSACWRSPMIQQLSYERFGVFYNVFSSETYIAFLTRVLAHTMQPIMLIQDGARYHTSAAMQRFFGTHIERLTIFQLPSDSPDDNPIEKLWKKVKKEGTHLHYFPTFEALMAKVEEALLTFASTPAEILALCSLPTE
jgi:transposase